MRILFFSHYFPPEGNAPAARTHAHCRRWAAAGHDVTVVTCAPNHPRGVIYPGYRNRLRSIEAMDGIRVVRVSTYLAANQAVWKRAASWVSYLLMATLFGLAEKRPDIVLATSPQPFCAWAGVLVSRCRRRPLLLEVRDLWPESIVAVGALRSRVVLGLLQRMAQSAYSAATRIVTVGEGYRRGLLDRGVAASRVAVVMNGVDRDLFRPRAPDPAVAGRLRTAGRFVVTYCGTIGLAHGLEVVLRAAAALMASGRPDVVFLMVGDGARLDALRAAATGGGLANVIFAGRVDRQQVPEVLACSDACLVHLRASPAFTGVMPSKIFEGAAMGLPIVLGVRGFAARFVEDAGCGLCIDPEDAGALAAAVLRLADDPALCRRLGRSGRAAAARFDRDRLAARYLAIIERTLRREAPP